MTQGEAIKIVREIRALERVDASIQRMMTTADAAFEWVCVRNAIDWQLRSLRYVLSLEHPLLVESAVDLVDAESATARSTRSESASLMMDDPPKGARVH